MNSYIVRLLATAGGAMSAFAGLPAFAQESAEPSAATETSFDPVIVVTANRRAQNLQEAAAVINVLGEELVQDLRITDMDTIVSVVPGLAMAGNARDQNRIGLRGAYSSADTPSAGQAVGLYIDGVYYGRSASLGPVLFDVERIEVLRGPQGTLYGPNVVGGLINIQTRDPSLSEMEGNVSATVGNFGLTEFGGRISFPLIQDELAVALTAMKTDSDGWQKNLVTGNRLGQVDTTALRGKLLWTPSESLRVEAFSELWFDDTYGEPRNLIPISGQPERFVVPEDFRETLLAVDAAYDRRVWTTGLSVAYDLTDAITLTSNTAYSNTDSVVKDQPFVAGPVERISAGRVSSIETFTQEFLLSGNQGSIRWQAGVYYLRDASSTLENFISTQVPGTPIVEFGYPEFFESNYLMDNDTESLSGFAQVTYSVTDELSITGGLRYTKETKDSFVRGFGDAFPGNYAIEEEFSLEQSASWAEFTPKFSVEYLKKNFGPFDSLLLYASATRGFKSGDFVKQLTRDASIGTTDPEFVWNYEGGFKTSFADRRVTFNGTYFYADYTALQSQVVQQTGFTETLNNDAVAQGVELELNLYPIEGLNLSASYAYIHTKLASPDPAVDGNRLPRAPENSFSLSGRYEWAVGNLNFSVLGSYSYQDGSYLDVENSEPQQIFDLTQSSYLTASFSVRYANAEISFWGKNLLNDEALVEANDLSALWSYTTAEFFGGKELFYNGKFAPPRTYGATVRFEF